MSVNRDCHLHGSEVEATEREDGAEFIPPFIE
jgi:hypothetical protein